MRKQDVIAHFGSGRAVAKALGISDSAVSQCKDLIPEKDAYRIQVLTEEKLQYRPEIYRLAA